MSDKFLGIGRGTLTDGTADLNINGLIMSGLEASQPIKTNGVKQLISSKLTTDDIEGLGSVLLNPMTANLSLGNNKITNLATPTDANDGATKDYVDSAGGGGGSDFSGLRGDTAKVDLLTVTTQPTYGTIEKYTSNGTIAAGQPVRPFYGSNGEVKVNQIGGLPTDLHQILGINLNSVVAGDVADILVNGFCTARFIAPVAPATNIQLNNTTNGTTQAMTNLISFTDSGGTGNNYGSSQNYSIIFDAGVGRTINWTVSSLGFEHSTTRLYDRLGVQTSTDGVVYTNIYDSGYHRTSNSLAPYGSYYYQNSTANSDVIGNVFPNGTSFITSNGGSLTKATNARYVKFFFISDSSATEPGWNILLVPDIAYNVLPIVVGQTLYLDNSNFTRLTLTDTSQLAVGYTAYTNGDNSSVFCKTNIAQHS